MAGGSAPTACEKIGSPKPQLTRTQGTQGVILYTVFLAGGIASGKSSVARELERRGAWRIDLDQVSRAVLEPGSDCLPEIADAFGDDLLDPQTGELDRGLLAGRAFADAEACALLEKIEMPHIKRMLVRTLEGEGCCLTAPAVCVVEVPLLDRVEDMLDLAHERGEAPFLILLDGITDPHNLGAIIRTAECAGAHGVIVQERRAVGLTPAAVKASAGAVEYLPVARVTNLTSTIERLKREGVWTYAADMDGEDYADLDLSGPIALVIGAEGEGVSRRVLESCDRTISVPIRGKLDSLNASVAAGVLMYAVLRAR